MHKEGQNIRQSKPGSIHTPSHIHKRAFTHTYTQTHTQTCVHADTHNLHQDGFRHRRNKYT